MAGSSLFYISQRAALIRKNVYMAKIESKYVTIFTNAFMHVKVAASAFVSSTCIIPSTLKE